jgi:hypothetical protein
MEDSDAHVELNPKPSPEDSESNTHTPVSDMTEAGTKKRSTPDDDNEEPTAEPAAKRRRTEDYGLQTPPAEDVIQAVLDTRPAFNDEPSHLLRRATALVLEHVGFDGATKEAIESLCGEVDSCQCPYPYTYVQTSTTFELLLTQMQMRPNFYHMSHSLCWLHAAQRQCLLTSSMHSAGKASPRDC